jgi:hypothetical protein
MVDPRDLYTVNELAARCMVNSLCITQAAEQLGPKKATRQAVCELALELRDQAAARKAATRRRR